MRHRISELLAGAGLFLRGFGTWAKSPGLMAVGAIPALIVGATLLVRDLRGEPTTVPVPRAEAS